MQTMVVKAAVAIHTFFIRIIDCEIFSGDSNHESRYQRVGTSLYFEYAN